MDKEISVISENMENKRWVEEKPLENGKGSVRTDVEQVSNGFIKVVTTNTEEGDYTHVKSIHEENPLEEEALVDKLKRVIDGKD